VAITAKPTESRKNINEKNNSAKPILYNSSIVKDLPKILLSANSIPV
jgi:hypothetical protein